MPHTKGGSLLSFPPKDPIYGVYNVQLHSKSLLGLPLQVFWPSIATNNQNQTQHIQIDFNKKSLPNQKTFQTFKVDARGFRKAIGGHSKTTWTK